MSDSIFRTAVERCEELVSTGRGRQAVHAMGILIEIAPGSCEAWYHLGRTCRRVGNLEKAESALAHAQDLLKTDSGEARIEATDIDCQLGHTYLQKGEYQKAAYFLSLLIPLRPCSFLLHWQLCHCFFSSSAWRDLEAEEERYLGQDPEELAEQLAYWLDDDLFSEDAYHHLGQLAYRRGDESKALEWWEKAFYAGVQYEMNVGIEEYLATYRITYHELVGLSRFQDSVNRQLDYALLTESDMEMMRRATRWYRDDRMQLKLDFGD